MSDVSIEHKKIKRILEKNPYPIFAYVIGFFIFLFALVPVIESSSLPAILFLLVFAPLSLLFVFYRNRTTYLALTYFYSAVILFIVIRIILILVGVVEYRGDFTTPMFFILVAPIYLWYTYSRLYGEKQDEYKAMKMYVLGNKFYGRGKLSEANFCYLYVQENFSSTKYSGFSKEAMSPIEGQYTSVSKQI